MKSSAILVLFLSLSTTFTMFSAKLEKERSEEVVEFVRKAVTAIEQRGQDVFPDFRTVGGEWFQDDLYVFVWGLDGIRYVYPPDFSGEGKNMLDLKDDYGRPIGHLFIEQAKKPSGGWVHYKWTKPDDDELHWKSSYIMKAISPDGVEFAVGAGLYDMPVEKVFVVQAVNDAVDYLSRVGLEGIDTMRLPSSPFIFLDTYVFIKTLDGVELLNPFKPELEGTSVLDLKDVRGRLFVREELEALKDTNEYWSQYYWERPGTEKITLKSVYLKKTRIADEDIVVGAGYYPVLFE